MLFGKVSPEHGELLFPVSLLLQVDRLVELEFEEDFRSEEIEENQDELLLRLSLVDHGYNLVEL